MLKEDITIFSSTKNCVFGILFLIVLIIGFVHILNENNEDRTFDHTFKIKMLHYDNKFYCYKKYGEFGEYKYDWCTEAETLDDNIQTYTIEQAHAMQADNKRNINKHKKQYVKKIEPIKTSRSNYALAPDLEYTMRQAAGPIPLQDRAIWNRCYKSINRQMGTFEPIHINEYRNAILRCLGVR